MWIIIHVNLPVKVSSWITNDCKIRDNYLRASMENLHHNAKKQQQLNENESELNIPDYYYYLFKWENMS